MGGITYSLVSWVSLTEITKTASIAQQRQSDSSSTKTAYLLPPQRKLFLDRPDPDIYFDTRPAVPPPCAGDCNEDGSVTVDELLIMVNAALGNTSVDGCSHGDSSGDGLITVEEIVAAVDRALNGC